MLNDPVLQHYLNALIIFAAAAVLGHLARMFFSTVLRRVFELTKTTLDDRIVEVLRQRIRLLFIIAGAFLGTREIRRGLTVEHVTHLQILEYVDVILYVFAVLVVTRLTGKIITGIVEWYIDEKSERTDPRSPARVAPAARRIINAILFFIAFLITLDHFGISISSLLVSLGVGSLGIALAAQETLANVIAGFVILIDQPFRVGDRIKLPTGEEGDIHEIGLRSTQILNYDNNLVIVPNSDLVKNRIVNFSYPEPSIRVLIDVGVAYGTDLRKVRDIVRRLVEGYPGLLQDPNPSVVLMNFGASSLEMRLLARTDDFTNKFQIETDLREKIYAAFALEGIEIPLPQQVVHITNPDEPQTPQTDKRL